MFSKLWFSPEENLKKCTSFEVQKGTRNIQENVYFGIIIFSRFSSIKPCLRSLLICFAREMKRFYQNSFKNEVDFTNIMDVSPNILAKNKKFKKLRHGFVDDNNINIFLSRENPCTFLLAKEKTWKRVFITNNELSQNRTEKQIMPFKTTVNLLFNDIWNCLVIGSFDWKFVVFQKTFVRVYCILNA